MFSKSFELSGFGLIAAGIAVLLGVGAGLIVAGGALLLVGGTTDDAAMKRSLKRGWGWVRFYWHRQILREQLEGNIPGRPSPHPPIEINPEVARWAEEARLSHISRIRERSRQGNGDQTLERLA